jgi:hypothetical protein
MISLPSYGPDYFVHLFGILVVIVRLKAADLAGKFGFNDSYCDLPPICNVQSWDTSPSTRFFEVATQLTLFPDFAIPLL